MSFGRFYRNDLQMDVLRQAKDAAVKSCNDQKREVESLMEQLDVAKQKLASTKQLLQVACEAVCYCELSCSVLNTSQ